MFWNSRFFNRFLEAMLRSYFIAQYCWKYRISSKIYGHPALFTKLFYGYCSFPIQQIPVCFSNEQTIILTLYGVMSCIYWTGILQSNKKITLRGNNKSDILVFEVLPATCITIIVEKRNMKKPTYYRKWAFLFLA